MNRNIFIFTILIFGLSATISEPSWGGKPLERFNPGGFGSSEGDSHGNLDFGEGPVKPVKGNTKNSRVRGSVGGGSSTASSQNLSGTHGNQWWPVEEETKANRAFPFDPAIAIDGGYYHENERGGYSLSDHNNKEHWHPSEWDAIQSYKKGLK